MPQIRNNLEASGIPVTIPLVIPSLVTSRVLVMQFISGYKLNEFGVLRREGADLQELTRLVCDALAYQMSVPRYAIPSFVCFFVSLCVCLLTCTSFPVSLCISHCS